MIWLGLFLIAVGIYVQVLRGGSPLFGPLLTIGAALIIVRLFQ